LDLGTKIENPTTHTNCIPNNQKPISIPPSKQAKLHSPETIAASKIYFIVISTHNATFNKMELPFCMKKTWQFLQRPKLLSTWEAQTIKPQVQQ
jgi:hypothetical protein